MILFVIFVFVYLWLSNPGFPPDHFKPEKYDLLRVFSEAAALHGVATLKVDELGAVIEQKNGVIKENPWVNIAVKMAAIMASTSVKLGISYSTTSKGQVDVPKPKSSRELAGLLFGG